MEPHELFKEWRLYDKVIAHNYMMHAEIIAHLIGILSSQHSQPFSMLELGCGDAYVSNEISKEHDINRYVGIDSSKEGLKIANQRLSNKDRTLSLIEGDILKELITLNEKFDIILAGFSIHHYGFEGKKKIFELLKDKCNVGSRIILYDIYKFDGESRKSALDRMIRKIQEEWISLSNEDFDSISVHISTMDYPEEIGQWQSLINLSGLENIRTLELDPTYGFVMFQASIK